MQDATKILFGSSGSSDRDVSAFAGDESVFKSGLAVRLKSDSTVSLLQADGNYLGVSVGRSLSDAKKIGVVRAGNWIPVRLPAGKRARGTITISNVSNLLSGTPDSVTVAGVEFTAQSSAVTHGGATFRAATGNTETAASLADQINNHATANLLVRASSSGAVVTVYALAPGVDGNSIGLAYTDKGTSTVGAAVSGANLTLGSATVDAAVKGASVYFDNVTGYADENTAFTTVSGAFYLSGPLTGVEPDGTTGNAAYIDMAGGL